MIMTLLTRLLYLLAGWGSVGLVYFSSDLLQGQGVILPETVIDRAIAYSDAAIWLPLTIVMSLALLRPIKGATVGLMLKLGMLKTADDA